MLMQTNSEVTKLQSQIDNCITLRGVIQRKIDEGHPIRYLDSFKQPCGTVGCVLGDWAILNNLDPLEVVVDECGELFAIGYVSDSPHNIHWCKIFGTSEDGTYQDRLDRINDHISTLEQRMANMLVAA